jgi:hypothetical protein
MSSQAENCIICAEEFNPDDLHNVTLSSINVTKFKICQNCLDDSDPENDYSQVKDMLSNYLSISNNKTLWDKVLK